MRSTCKEGMTEAVTMDVETVVTGDVMIDVTTGIWVTVALATVLALVLVALVVAVVFVAVAAVVVGVMVAVVVTVVVVVVVAAAAVAVAVVVVWESSSSEGGDSGRSFTTQCTPTGVTALHTHGFSKMLSQHNMQA